MGYFEAILEILLLFSIGFGLRLLGAAKFAPKINWLLTYFMSPVLVISRVTRMDFSEFSAMGSMVLSALAIIALGVILSYILTSVLGFNRVDKGSIIVLSTFHNAAQLPFPILETLYGNLTAAIFYYQASFMAHLTFGGVLCAIFGSQKFDLRGLLKSVLSFPPLPTLLVSIILVLMRIRLPYPMDELTYWVSRPAPYLMPIVLGMRLPVGSSFNKTIMKAIGIVGLIRLLLSPVLGMVLASIFRLEGIARASLIVEASMPPANINLILLAKYKLNQELGASAILLTTIASLLTVFIYLSVS